MKRGILVYNPTAGQRDRRAEMSALIDRQRRRGLELVNAPTSGPGDATAIVKSFLARGIDVVAVCGGDGTISEAAWGLEGSSVALAVLPGGTSNVFAIELGIPTEVEQAEVLLQEGATYAVRLAHADGRAFLLWAGAGLDARVMGNMRPAWKRLLGRVGILPTAVDEFLRYEFPRLEVTVDGAVHAATFAVACRARHYGGKWVIAPNARIDADQFEVLLFSHTSRRKLAQLFQLMAAGHGGHLEGDLARIVRGRDVAIRSLDGPVEIQVDGDCLLETPIACRVGTETVQVLVPKRRGS
ncbi:MAG TPA: diacylglycerol kinase family protein [Thermoanaerobaculia bacterium]|jgi:diacylglycerol kinase (ATP)|nr:diacylglycerol kinase family protein [Thermoanaerobaculia bacterium]